MTITVLIGERLKQKFLVTNSFNFNNKPSKDYKNYIKQLLFFLLGNPPLATLINLFIDTFLNTTKLHCLMENSNTNQFIHRHILKYNKIPFFDGEMHKLDFIA